MVRGRHPGTGNAREIDKFAQAQCRPLADVRPRRRKSLLDDRSLRPALRDVCFESLLLRYHGDAPSVVMLVHFLDRHELERTVRDDVDGRALAHRLLSPPASEVTQSVCGAPGD
jgi:hypothetical protein